MWIYLCAILQYYEDDMANWEGALYGGKTQRPSALILDIMEHINPGLPEPYRVQWHNIVRKTPWLAAQDHLNREELDRFYHEPGPEISSELEQATEDVYCRPVEDAAQRETGNTPIPPSCADEAQTWNSLGVQLPEYKDTPDLQPEQTPSMQQDRPHKFVEWVLLGPVQ